MRTRSTFTASALLLAALGCRDETTSLTEPRPAPQVEVTASTSLSFWQVSAAGYHSCGVTAHNRVYCWGNNDHGELGDGTTSQRLRPVAVATTLRFRQVSTGAASTCGVTTDYQAYCWGGNWSGQLGDGTSTHRATPTKVAGGLKFRRVETGAHTCGVSYPDGRAYCWGRNSGEGTGAVGDGTRIDRLTPVAVVSGHAFRQVTTGAGFSCGVTTDDRAYCWGYNRFGMLGDSTEAEYRLEPTPVAGDRRWRQVDAFGLHTCAVTTGNRAFCWGWGRYGQIGDGKTYVRFWPRRVASGLSFSRVTAGWGHSCGETTDNRAYCWGLNDWRGALGDGTTINRLTPVPVAGGLPFSQLSAGLYHTCAKTPAGVAYCWGWGRYGQLGNGKTAKRLTPTPVADPLER